MKKLHEKQVYLTHICGLFRRESEKYLNMFCPLMEERVASYIDDSLISQYMYMRLSSQKINSPKKFFSHIISQAV